MIRHGQSVANEGQYMSGNMDVALTDLGREQANTARQHVEALTTRPVNIVHSHLQRARHTAEIINQNINSPLHETSLLGEIHFGDWENQPWYKVRDRFYAGENPPNGETHDEFSARVKDGINWALEIDGPVLIACHGGVFRAFNHLYNKKIKPIKNCVLYEFIPNKSQQDFPWIINEHG